MSYKVRLRTFEGPFDLLVYLIENAQMSIYDIQVSEITSQYLEYLEMMREHNIELSSEFMVLAAELIEIKSRMKEHDLKSKDMKRFIEYGWLLAIDKVSETEGFKLNFRDGVQRVAGLSNYSKVYEMSSEIAHSSPLLIYSEKNYFYHITILNLYESFFRLEKIFASIYMSTVGEEERQRYLSMRSLYFGELLASYNMKKAEFTRN